MHIRRPSLVSRVMLGAVVAVFALIPFASGGPAAAAVMPALQESFASPGAASQLVYSDKYNLLFLRNSGSAVRVIDTTTRSQVDLRLATELFTDIDLTPSGDYLYAADFGGEVTGYGTPVRPSHVHRFNLATRTWESRQAPLIGYRLEAVDDSRFVLQESDQWVGVTLNTWGAASGIAEVARRDWWVYSGDIEFDPTTGRLIHGDSGTSGPEIDVLRISGDTFVNGEGSGLYGTADSGGGSSVLSTDFQNFYYGRLQVEALDVRNNRRMFPEIIRAGTSDLALGQAGVYDAATGANLGSFNLTAPVFGVSADGNHIWAYSANNLYHYAVPEPGAGMMLLAAGAAVLMRRTRGGAGRANWRERRRRGILIRQ